MTLSSETVRTSYDGDDATVAFSTVFVFWDDSDVRVVHRDSSGTETVYVKGTNYTLTGGSGAVGTVTTKTGFTVATGEKLVIISARANTQGTSLATGGALPSANIEQAFDQTVRLVQQDAEELGRKVGFSETSTNSDIDLPDLVASELWQVNSAGTALTSVTLAEISSSALTTPVTLVNGGAEVDLTGLTGSDYIRLNSGKTALEGQNISETVANLFAKGSDIASADPLVIGTDGGYFDVTGTTTFDEQTVAAGRLYMLQFDGALTMTDDADHDLGGADITTAAGDRAIFYATAANTVQLISFWREGGQVTGQATQAAIEAETNENTYVPPDLMKHHPGVGKAWLNFDGTTVDGNADLAGVGDSYNVTSVVDNGSGDYTIAWATDFSSANYALAGMARSATTSQSLTVGVANDAAPAAGSVTIEVQNDAGTKADEEYISVMAMGDQ